MPDNTVRHVMPLSSLSEPSLLNSIDMTSLAEELIDSEQTSHPHLAENHVQSANLCHLCTKPLHVFTNKCTLASLIIKIHTN